MDPNKILKISIAVAIVLIGVSVFYYFVIFIPQGRTEQEATASSTQAALNDCLNQAQADYQNYLSINCTDEGSDYKCEGYGTNPSFQAQTILNNEKDQCFKQYK